MVFIVETAYIMHLVIGGKIDLGSLKIVTMLFNFKLMILCEICGRINIWNLICFLFIIIHIIIQWSTVKP